MHMPRAIAAADMQAMVGPEGMVDRASHFGIAAGADTLVVASPCSQVSTLCELPRIGPAARSFLAP